MPRKGPAYPILKGWRQAVLDRMEEINRERVARGEGELSQNQFARDAGIAPSSLSEALAAGAVQTTVMAEIHKVLGWDPPPITFSPDQFELLKLYSNMNEFERGQYLERARQAAAKARKKP